MVVVGRLPGVVSLVLVLVTGGSLAGSGQIPPYGGAARYVADLAARRAKTIAALGPESILIAWSAPARVYSTDVDYEYRQESNLLYLTGIDQEETILVLVPGAKTRKEILFTREADPRREHWEGHTLTPAEVTSASGVAAVYPLSAFQPFVDALLGGTGHQQSPDDAAAEFGVFFEAVKQGKARLGILERLGGAGGRGARSGQPPAPPPAGSHAAWALDQQTKYPGVTTFAAGSILTTQRQLKTPYEQTVLRRSVEISAEAHIEGMKAARPGGWEYEVEAAIEYWYLKNGALSWGYPSIVGSGPNATILHYGKSTRQMKDGDLLLVDAAANFQGLTGDITRTYPVNGRFSADQRALYELVLQAQDAGIAAARAGTPTSAITQACRAVFAHGLLKLGLITETDPGEAQNAQVGRWFTHGPVHGIGVDVHDPLGQQLAVGSAFVIEPGLYIREVVLDQLPKTPENLTFIEKVRPAVKRFKDMSVRIEDSFLLSDKGLEMLSARAPRQAGEIERVMRKGQPSCDKCVTPAPVLNGRTILVVSESQCDLTPAGRRHLRPVWLSSLR
jgi:Xaa-Pro aminopeptidase